MVSNRGERSDGPQEWVWRGSGHKAHLIPAARTTSSNPHALCGQRVRQPRRHWNGICPTCVKRALDLTEPWQDIPPAEMR